MATAACNQVAFRGRDDTQTLNSSTFTYSQNTNWSQDVDTTFRIRFEMEEVNSKTFTVTGQLQYSLNSGSWTSVTSSSSVVKGVTSSQFTDGDATTNILTASSRTFVAGQGICDGVANNVSLSNTQTEHEYCVQIVGTDVSHNDTIQLRVGTLTAYTVTPTVTVNKVTALEINKSEGLTAADTASASMPDALTKSVADNTGVTDTSPIVQVQQATPLDINKSDTLAISETLNAATDDLLVQVDDGVTSEDVPQVEFEALPPYAISISTEPSVAIADIVLLSIDDLQIDVSSTIGVGDTTSASIPDSLTLSRADDIIVADAYEGFINDLATTSEDNIGISEDVPVFFFPSGEDFEISKTDSVEISETVSAEIPDDLIVSGSDTANIGEDVYSQLADLETTNTDTISIADAVEIEKEEEIIFVIAVAETVKARDIVPGRYFDSIALDETITVYLQAIFTPAINVTDTIDASEVANIVLEDLSLSTSDTASVSELSYIEEGSLVVTWSENITLEEASDVFVEAIAGIAINVSDGVTLDEAVFAAIQDNLLVNKVDSVLVGDGVYVVREVEGEYSLIVSDGVGVGETITVSMPDSLVVNEYDGITISDFASIQEGIYVTISEGAQLYDYAATAISTSIISIIDGLSIGDSRTVSLGNLTIDKADTLDIQDVPEGFVGISLSVNEDVNLEDIAAVLMLEALAISVFENALVSAQHNTWVYGLGVAEPDIFLYNAFINSQVNYTAKVETYEVIVTVQDVYMNTRFSYDAGVDTIKGYTADITLENEVEIVV